MSYEITDADRRAAEELRILLADASGFWLKPGDDTALCALVVRLRMECEQRLIDKLDPLGKALSRAQEDDDAPIQHCVGTVLPLTRRKPAPGHA